MDAGLPEQGPTLLASLAFGFVSAFLPLLFAYAFHVYVSKPRQILRRLQAQGIPGYPFRPYVGQIPDILKMYGRRDADPAMAATTEATMFWTHGTRQFGRIWTFQEGTTVCVVISDPDTVRQAYVVRSNLLPKQDYTKKALHMLGDGLVLSHGDHWQRQRRLIGPAFSMREVKRYFPIMCTCTEAAVAQWADKVSKTSDGATLPMDVELAKLTMDIVFRSVFGVFGDGFFTEAERQELADALALHFPSAMNVQQIAGVIPLYRYIPTSLNLGVWRSRRIILKHLRRIIRARLAEHKREGSSSRSSSDLLGMLLEASELQTTHPPAHDFEDATGGHGLTNQKAASDGEDTSARTSDSKAGGASLGKTLMTERELMDECATFFAAGSETTANLLTWTMMLLSQHPTWQQRAREEVKQMCGDGQGWSPTFEDLSELNVLSCILYESLRLYPPAPIITRSTKEEVRISEKLTLPPGCDLYVVIEHMHKDKELWGPDADEFRPERFGKGVMNASKLPGAFMPFSMGPRVCLGQNFAMVEAKVIMGAILSRFSWRLSEGYAHHPEALVTMRAKHGMPLVLLPLTQ